VLLDAAEALGAYRLLQEELTWCSRLALQDLADVRSDIKPWAERVAVLTYWLQDERYPYLFERWPAPARRWVMGGLMHAIANGRWASFIAGLKMQAVVQGEGEKVQWVRYCESEADLALLARSEPQTPSRDVYWVIRAQRWASPAALIEALRAELERNPPEQHPGRPPAHRPPDYRLQVRLFNVYDSFRRALPDPRPPWEDHATQRAFVKAVSKGEVDVKDIWPELPSRTTIADMLDRAVRWLRPNEDALPPDEFLRRALQSH
jgi:hypothetical protein